MRKSAVPRRGQSKDIGSIPPHMLPDRGNATPASTTTPHHHHHRPHHHTPSSIRPPPPPSSATAASQTPRARRRAAAAVAASTARSAATGGTAEPSWAPRSVQQHRSLSPALRGSAAAVGNTPLPPAASPAPRPQPNRLQPRPAQQQQQQPPPPLRAEPPSGAGLQLLQQQLALSVEQGRSLRDENKLLKASITPQIPSLNANEPLSKFLTSIDDVISHHERIAGATGPLGSPSSPLAASPPRATAATGGAPASAVPVAVASPPRLPDEDEGQSALPVNASAVPVSVPTAQQEKEKETRVLANKLKLSEAAVAEQAVRIQELEARLKQREDHIDTLTRSLINLGQHSAKLQAQVCAIVNEKPRVAAAAVDIDATAALLSPNRALDGVAEDQAKASNLDAEILTRFESRLSARQQQHQQPTPDAAAAASVAGGTGPQDMQAILSAIEDHKQRAEQIVELNKQSMGALHSYYLDDAAVAAAAAPADAGAAAAAAAAADAEQKAATAAALDAVASLPPSYPSDPQLQDQQLRQQRQQQLLEDQLQMQLLQQKQQDALLAPAAVPAAPTTPPRDTQADAAAAAAAATAAAASKLYTDALASGVWAKRFDEALQRTYYYNEGLNKVSWNLQEDLLREAQDAAQQLGHTQGHTKVMSPPAL